RGAQPGRRALLGHRAHPPAARPQRLVPRRVGLRHARAAARERPQPGGGGPARHGALAARGPGDGDHLPRRGDADRHLRRGAVPDAARERMTAPGGCATIRAPVNGGWTGDVLTPACTERWVTVSWTDGSRARGPSGHPEGETACRSPISIPGPAACSRPPWSV